MSSKHNDKAPSAHRTSGRSSQQQQGHQASTNQNKIPSPASDIDAQKQAPAWPPQQQQDAFQQREWERTFAMLWEKPAYRPSSSSPTLKLDEQVKGPRLRRARSIGVTPPIMLPDRRGGAGRRTSECVNDAEAFKGATPLENWLMREERHERFLGKGGCK